jgi:hypothetical protein
MSVIGWRKFGRRDWVESRKTTPFRDGGVTQLLLRAENRILRHLEDAELNHGFAGNIDLLFVEGLIPVRAFLFCFTSFPISGTTNSPSFLAAL